MKLLLVSNALNFNMVLPACGYDRHFLVGIHVEQDLLQFFHLLFTLPLSFRRIKIPPSLSQYLYTYICRRQVCVCICLMSLICCVPTRVHFKYFTAYRIKESSTEQLYIGNVINLMYLGYWLL
jgi:hypothetical protein